MDPTMTPSQQTLMNHVLGFASAAYEATHYETRTNRDCSGDILENYQISRELMRTFIKQALRKNQISNSDFQDLNASIERYIDSVKQEAYNSAKYRDRADLCGERYDNFKDLQALIEMLNIDESAFNQGASSNVEIRYTEQGPEVSVQLVENGNLVQEITIKIGDNSLRVKNAFRLANSDCFWVHSDDIICPYTNLGVHVIINDNYEVCAIYNVTGGSQ